MVVGPTMGVHSEFPRRNERRARGSLPAMSEIPIVQRLALSNDCPERSDQGPNHLGEPNSTHRVLDPDSIAV
jgi:hypothetical protein